MKKLLSILLALACVMTLAACGKKDQPAQSGSQSASQSGTASQEVDFSGVKIRVAAMNGPTGMGMALLADRAQNSDLSYQCSVTFSGSPDDVRAGLLSGELDIAAVPVNMAAALYNSRPLHQVDGAYPNGVCLVIGSEGQGLTEAAVAACDAAVRIPITDRVESLNASVAGSVLLWHFRRPEED